MKLSSNEKQQTITSYERENNGMTWTMFSSADSSTECEKRLTAITRCMDELQWNREQRARDKAKGTELVSNQIGELDWLSELYGQLYDNTRQENTDKSAGMVEAPSA